MTTAEPSRTVAPTVGYRCQCQILTLVAGLPAIDVCAAQVSGPDEPMCDACLSSGHAQSARQLPLSDPRRRR